jgi:hypothetical protein
MMPFFSSFSAPFHCNLPLGPSKAGEARAWEEVLVDRKLMGISRLSEFLSHID